MIECIMAVDPGLSGAIAFYFPSHPERVSVEDMPVAGGDIDCVTLAGRIRQLAPDIAIVEAVHSMPRQGVSSTFKFGAGYGMVRGVIAALDVPTHLVTPAAWKKHFRLGSDKEQARALALRLFPSVGERFARKKDDGRAEAALIARYGADKLIPTRVAA